jgi:nucleoside-triphosphatase THEP1
LIIVLSWIFIVGPLLKQLLQSWLKQKQTRSKQEITQVLALLPETQTIISESWKYSAGKKGWGRFKYFSKLVLVNALQSSTENKIIILSASIQTGKTTSIIEWAKNRKDVWGVATPVINGKRVFLDLQTNEEFHMEALAGETETLSVGRFLFSRKNFERAVSIIKNAVNQKGWLVIDEIGPMELRGEGFAEVLSTVLKNRNEPLLLVVREGMVDKVKEHFGINNAKAISSIGKVYEIRE